MGSGNIAGWRFPTQVTTNLLLRTPKDTWKTSKNCKHHSSTIISLPLGLAQSVLHIATRCVLWLCMAFPQMMVSGIGFAVLGESVVCVILVLLVDERDSCVFARLALIRLRNAALFTFSTWTLPNFIWKTDVSTIMRFIHDCFEGRSKQFVPG